MASMGFISICMKAAGSRGAGAADCGAGACAAGACGGATWVGSGWGMGIIIIQGLNMG